MTTNITHLGGVITPIALEGYRASRRANTIVQDVLNQSEPSATYRAFGLRDGRLTLVFDSNAAAAAAMTALSRPQKLTLANTDVPTLGMPFVIAGGDLDIEQDADGILWRVIVPFKEVLS